MIADSQIADSRVLALAAGGAATRCYSSSLGVIRVSTALAAGGAATDPERVPVIYPDSFNSLSGFYNRSPSLRSI